MRTLPASSSSRELRVAVNLVAPWAYADEFGLDGIEVRTMQAYARWSARTLSWFHVPKAQLPEALALGDVDIAIGGLRAWPALCRQARVLRLGHRPRGKGAPDGAGSGLHEWAIRRGAWAVELETRLFLGWHSVAFRTAPRNAEREAVSPAPRLRTS